MGTPSKTTLIFADEDTTIGDYNIEIMNADYELFNVHLGQINKQVNDLREIKRKKEQDKNFRSINEVQDLEDMFHEKKID